MPTQLTRGRLPRRGRRRSERNLRNSDLLLGREIEAPAENPFQQRSLAGGGPQLELTVAVRTEPEPEPATGQFHTDGVDHLSPSPVERGSETQDHGQLDDTIPPLWRQRTEWLVRRLRVATAAVDRKSTRLNSSHLVISYAVFC